MQKMMKEQRNEIKKMYSLELPSITRKRYQQSVIPSLKREYCNNFHEEQAQTVAKLDEWTTSLPVIKKQRNMMSESIFYLYKSVNSYISPNSRTINFGDNFQNEIASVNGYLVQLQHQLTKIKKIKYFSIYRNVEYCAGIYQIAVNQVLKKIDGFERMMEQSLENRKKEVEGIRERQLKEVTIRDQNKNMSRIIKNNRQDEIKQHNDEPQINKEQTNNQQSDHEEDEQLTKSINIDIITKSITPKLVSPTQQPNKCTRSQFLIQNLQQTKQLIQNQQKKMKEIWKMLDKIEQARARTLSFVLQLGYDIRDEGLLWLLKKINSSYMEKKQKNRIGVDDYTVDHSQIIKNSKITKQNYIPTKEQFPQFLTTQEINYIISKFRNDFKLYEIQIQKQNKQSQEKQVIHAAFDGVMRNNNRKLSIIRQRQLRAKLLKQRQTAKLSGHKYLNENTLQLLQKSSQIRATKNELIYQETVKKLNKFCGQEIHGKGRNQSNKHIKSNNNIVVKRLMGEVEKMVLNYQNLREQEDRIKTDEERQLSDIIRKLRNQMYEEQTNWERRNPISVICCLVGWRKAKKILENEMNISMSMQH